MNWYAWRDDALLLELSLQPGARRNEWQGLHGERLKLRIHAPPVDGRANDQLIEFLADEFAVPKAHIRLLHGHASRHKRVAITQPARLPIALQHLGMASSKTLLTARPGNAPA